MEQFKNIESPSGAKLMVDGKEILSFGGCCYLGMSGNSELIEAGTKALQRFGMTAQMSRYYGFSREPGDKVEEAARDFFEVEGALYFSTGYLFGMIALAGIADRYDVIFLDEKTHYSLQEGAVITGKPIFTFKHMDAADLENVIKEKLTPGQIPLIGTDGMFPTFGDVPPLAEYKKIADRYNGWLVIDESHSFGAVGTFGRGAAELCGINRERVITGGSLAKAFCAFGGIAIGAADVIEALQKAPAARGSTCGAAPAEAIAASSLTYVKNHPEMLEKLRANAQRLKTGLKAMGIEVEDSGSPVATFTFGKAADMIKLQEDLWDAGIFVGYTTYVGAGPEGAIRCAVFSDHELQDIDRLLSELKARI